MTPAKSELSLSHGKRSVREELSDKSILMMMMMLIFTSCARKSGRRFVALRMHFWMSMSTARKCGLRYYQSKNKMTSSSLCPPRSKEEQELLIGWRKGRRGMARRKS